MGAVERIQPPFKDDDNCSLIDQLDGNVSLSTTDSFFCVPDIIYCIPVHTSQRLNNEQPSNSLRLPTVLKTVRRSNKVLQAATLPKISNYNMRSLMPKIQNFGIDMQDRNCSISFLTEVWEKAENKKHQLKLEELFELKGMKYISTPRPGVRRGGGAAIVVNTEQFSISKLNVQIPSCLEIVWGLAKPVEVTGKITKIIMCCFYCLPKSTRKTALIDHMTFTLQSLLNTFPKAGILICGDRNDLGIDRLLSIDTSLKQLLNLGTRGPKILDAVITNMNVFFKEPEIVPPIDVDDPLKGGSPSDHSGVVVEPINDAEIPAKRIKICKTIRPITSSSLNNIGQVFIKEKWDFLDPSLPPSSLTELFEFFTSQILDIFCPTKVCYSSPHSLPWYKEYLKILRRGIQREYEKRGKSRKYYEMQSSYDGKLTSEMQKYKETSATKVDQ